MRSVIRLCISLLGIGLLSQVSLADDAPPTADATPVAAAPAASASDSNKTPLDLAFERHVKDYKVREKDGRKLYCRKETPLGTRMPKTVCLSEDQLRDEVIAMQAARDALRKPGVSPCGNGKTAC